MKKRTDLRKLITIISFIICGNNSQAQIANDSLCTYVSTFKDFSSLADNCQIFVDSTNTKIPSSILPTQWVKLNSLKLGTHIPSEWVNQTVYLKFLLKNDKNVATTLYFFPGNSLREITVFKKDTLANSILHQLNDNSKVDGYQAIDLQPKEKSYYIVELHFTKRRFNSLTPQVIQEPYIDIFQKMTYTVTYNQLIVGYLLSGLLLMMVFYNAANFYLSRKKEFLYNCLYAVCMFGLIYFNTYIERRSGVFASFFMGYLGFILLVTGTIFYIAFTRKFIETKNNYPLLDKIFQIGEKVLLLLIFSFSYIYFFTSNFFLQNLIENGTKIVLLLLGIIYIVLALREKNKLLNYLAIGNVILIFFSTISFLLIVSPIKRTSIFSSALLYYETGVVFELIFFLLGLTYKSRKELIEKIEDQQAMKLEVEKQAFETKLSILNAQQEERNRISADMHDDLGAGVTAIRLFSELAKSRLGPNNIPEMDKISSSANELLNNMNAIIWTMNSSNDTFKNLVAYIRTYAIEYFENTGIDCKFEISPDLPDMFVQGETRRNIFLVVKEALNNILKHANATIVTLTLKRDNSSISFFIHDNGNGIDFTNLRQFGIGLKNMKQRMEKSGIEFTIENKNGTLITLYKPKQN